MLDFEILNNSLIQDEFPERRDCFSLVEEYLKTDKVSSLCAIYGLRRTGKTVLLKQAFLSLSNEEREKSLFMTCNKKTDFYNVVAYMKSAIEHGKKYFFIDEITYANNFQDLAEVLSDNFIQNSNVRILITGTDSLGLSLPSHSNLYDRIDLIHTTYMSFPEFVRITGNDSIDYYMKHGSTLSEESPFENYSTTQEYIETSIVENFISSLQKSEGLRSYPPALTELYDNKELENSIQRIINQYPQSITISALRRQFKLSPLNNAVNAMAKNKQNPDLFIKSQIVSEQITNNVKRLLKIDDFSTVIAEDHLNSIKKFLKEMDVIVSIPVITSFTLNKKNIDLEIISHPGMYHANLGYTINQLNDDSNWLPTASEQQKKALLHKVYECSAGKIQENFIITDIYKMLCKNKTSDLDFIDNNKWYVSKFSDTVNEINEEADLIIVDKQKKEVFLFEIKHSSEVDDEQVRHLESSNLLNYIKENFGDIKNCAVLYNGQNDFSHKTPRINVSDFLMDIYKKHNDVDYSISKTLDSLKKTLK